MSVARRRRDGRLGLVDVPARFNGGRGTAVVVAAERWSIGRERSGVTEGDACVGTAVVVAARRMLRRADDAAGPTC